MRKKVKYVICIVLVLSALCGAVSACAAAAGSAVKTFDGSNCAGQANASNGVYITNALDVSGRATVRYLDYSGNMSDYVFDYSYRIPEIVCSSEDARSVNESIRTTFNGLIEQMNSPYNEGYLGEVDWKCTEMDGVFLLHVDYHPYNINSAYDELAFISNYYFDTQSGTSLYGVDILARLGFDPYTVRYGAYEQVKHDFYYYWMQISAEEPESVMKSAWEMSRFPLELEYYPELWYDGEFFSFSWHFDNGSAHGAQTTVTFDPYGGVLLFPGETEYRELPYY